MSGGALGGCWQQFLRNNLQIYIEIGNMLNAYLG